MAASPQFKIYNEEGEYIGALKYAVDAARLIGTMPNGTSIRYGHRHIVWTEGKEEVAAYRNLMQVTQIIDERVRALRSHV